MNKYEIRDEIDRLECLRGRLAALQTELEERQSVRKRRLAEFLHAGFRLKIVSEYYSGMESLLNGAEFSRAYDGLAEAKDAVLREENKLRDQMEERSYVWGNINSE